MISRIKREEKKREEERILQLKERFNADHKDIIAFCVAIWQLLLPLFMALLIIGIIVILIFSFF